MDDLLTDFVGMAVMLGKGFAVAFILFIAVLLWRLYRGHEVKHQPPIMITKEDEYGNR